MFCNKCGADLAGAGGFCTRCGAATGEERTVAVAPAARLPVPELRGVGGWLLFFCVLYTIIRPLMVIRYLMPVMRPDRVLNYVGLADIALGMILGLLLWRGYGEVLAYLKAYFALDVIVIGLRLWAASVSNSFNPLRLVQPSLGVGLVFLWYLYFRNSVRVRNTYGRNI